MIGRGCGRLFPASARVDARRRATRDDVGRAGRAALLVLVRHSTPDKVLPEIQQYGGEVLQTSLSNEAEERLRDALGERTAAG